MVFSLSFSCCFCARVLCMCGCVIYLFYCTKSPTQDKSTTGRVDRQETDSGVLVLVVAVVVMGLRARGCQVGSAVSLRISQDQTPPSFLFLRSLIYNSP